MRSFKVHILATAGLGCLLALPITAKAADLDYDVLRGADDEYDAPVSVIDWSGVYVGGHGGYSSASYGFKNPYQSHLANQFHDTTAESVFSISTLLRSEDKRVEGASYGAFVGYNWQFGDVVLGVEGDYSRFGITGASSDSQGRTQQSGDLLESVYASGSSKTRLEEFGTIRGRVGYAIGNFLPFATGGIAIGSAKINDTVSAQSYGFNQTAYNANVTNGTSNDYFRYGYSRFDIGNPYGGTPYTYTSTFANKTKTVGGFSVGAGLEYALTSNILLRGEYQYVSFGAFDGHRVNLNTVRAGAALKF